MLDSEELLSANYGHQATGASGRGAPDGGMTVEHGASGAARGPYASDAIDAVTVAAILRCSPRTARRRLAVWHRAPANTAPRVKLLGGWRRGRRSYYTTRAEIARYYPEIDDG